MIHNLLSVIEKLEAFLKNPREFYCNEASAKQDSMSAFYAFVTIALLIFALTQATVILLPEMLYTCFLYVKLFLFPLIPAAINYTGLVICSTLATTNFFLFVYAPNKVLYLAQNCYQIAIAACHYAITSAAAINLYFTPFYSLIANISHVLLVNTHAVSLYIYHLCYALLSSVYNLCCMPFVGVYNLMGIIFKIANSAFISSGLYYLGSLISPLFSWNIVLILAVNAIVLKIYLTDRKKSDDTNEDAKIFTPSTVTSILILLSIGLLALPVNGFLSFANNIGLFFALSSIIISSLYFIEVIIKSLPRILLPSDKETIRYALIAVVTTIICGSLTSFIALSFNQIFGFTVIMLLTMLTTSFISNKSILITPYNGHNKQAIIVLWVTSWFMPFTLSFTISLAFTLTARLINCAINIDKTADRMAAIIAISLATISTAILLYLNPQLIALSDISSLIRVFLLTASFSHYIWSMPSSSAPDTYSLHWTMIFTTLTVLTFFIINSFINPMYSIYAALDYTLLNMTTLYVLARLCAEVEQETANNASQEKSQSIEKIIAYCKKTALFFGPIIIGVLLSIAAAIIPTNTVNLLMSDIVLLRYIGVMTIVSTYFFVKRNNYNLDSSENDIKDIVKSSSSFTLIIVTFFITVSDITPIVFQYALTAVVLFICAQIRFSNIKNSKGLVEILSQIISALLAPAMIIVAPKYLLPILTATVAMKVSLAITALAIICKIITQNFQFSKTNEVTITAMMTGFYYQTPLFSLVSVYKSVMLAYLSTLVSSIVLDFREILQNIGSNILNIIFIAAFITIAVMMPINILPILSLRTTVVTLTVAYFHTMLKITAKSKSAFNNPKACAISLGVLVGLYGTLPITNLLAISLAVLIVTDMMLETISGVGIVGYNACVGAANLMQGVVFGFPKIPVDDMTASYVQQNVLQKP